jgi:(2Fe-2S) ferredoxin
MEKQNAPSRLHIFVCVNDRKNERPSCADNESVEIHARLKAIAKEKEWANEKVRVSKCGCLGLCGQGPNIVIYPRGIHFSKVSLDDLPEIESAIERSISEAD